MEIKGLVIAVPRVWFWFVTRVEYYNQNRTNCYGRLHYGDVWWSSWRLELLVRRVFAQQFVQIDNKEMSEVSISVSLCGNRPVSGGFHTLRVLTRKMFPFDDVMIERVRSLGYKWSLSYVDNSLHYFIDFTTTKNISCIKFPRSIFTVYNSIVFRKVFKTFAHITMQAQNSCKRTAGVFGYILRISELMLYFI